MKIFLIIFLYFFFNSNATLAADTLYFSGNIKVSKTVTYTYYLRFSINIENKLTGYSLTDPGGLNETKTRISGDYDSINKIITFQKNNVIRSKVDLNKNDLCFVRASLVLKKTKFFETLTGNFKGFASDKTTQCANGEIKLINTNKVKIILKNINETNDNKIKPGAIENNSSSKIIKISDATGKEFEITGNKIKLSIWDNGQVDGDRIAILLNGKYILEDYSTTAIKKIMEISLSGKEVDTLQIVALNEGTLPPNTAAIVIETPFEQYPIMTQAKLNEVRTLYLRKKLH